VDTIRFEIGERDVPAMGIVDRVDVFVNGRNLVDVLRGGDALRRARRQTPPRRQLRRLPFEEVFLTSPRLLGEPTTCYDHDSPEGKIPVLGRGCGDVGCWPFRVRITLRDDVVIWDDFEQPHRRAWRYDEMRPFVFDGAQYLSALDRKPA
jgi:hypothetical protein